MERMNIVLTTEVSHDVSQVSDFSRSVYHQQRAWFKTGICIIILLDFIISVVFSNLV